MTLRTKLALATGFLLIMLCGLGIFSLTQMDRINAAATEIIDEWFPATRYAMRLDTLASDFRIAEIRHIYASDQKTMAEYEKTLDGLLATFEKTSSSYAVLLDTAAEQKMWKTFEEQWRQYMQVHKDILKLSREEQTEKAIEMLNTASRDLYHKTADTLATIVEFNVKGSQKTGDHGGEIFSDSKKMVISMLIAVLFISVILMTFIIRNALRQLGKDPGELNAIALRVVDGDYHVDDGGKKMGVYGAIVEMVHALKTHIENAQRESENAKEQSVKAQEAMQQAEAASREAQGKTEAMLAAADKLEQVGNVVSSASSELSAQIEQSDRGAAESAQRLSEAATAMNEMNATVQEVARNAGSASAASAETKEKAEAGAHVVEKAVRSIEEVHQMSLDLKEDMTQLNEHAQDITRIMGVISDIADQTNLLALNAAIEAARAGEAGRGFAVVADEVRKLAEKTMASTNDVGNAIKAIQESTAKSMTGVDNAVERIGEATELASRSGAALEEIVATVEATGDQVNAIATASEEQSAASEEINQSIVQVNDMSRQTAEAMAEAAKAVSDLAAQAQGLTNLIQELKQA